MTKLKYITVLFIVASFFTSCAKRGTITGGPKDTIAPKIVGSFPENFSTNFKGNEIKINLVLKTAFCAVFFLESK